MIAQVKNILFNLFDLSKFMSGFMFILIVFTIQTITVDKSNYDCEIAGEYFENSYLCVVNDSAKIVGALFVIVDSEDNTEIDELFLLVIIYALGFIINLWVEVSIYISYRKNLKKVTDGKAIFYNLEENRTFQKFKHKYLAFITICFALLVGTNTIPFNEESYHFISITLLSILILSAIYFISESEYFLSKAKDLYEQQAKKKEQQAKQEEQQAKQEERQIKQEKRQIKLLRSKR